jgi:signal transduction histidine kinase
VTATALRALFVVLGAAFALAVGITAFTLLVLAAGSGPPPWTLVLLGIVVVGAPLSIGLLPAARAVEAVAAQNLLGVRLDDAPTGPASTWAQRRRTLGWFVLHLGAGLTVVAAVVGDIALAGSWWTVPATAATVAAVLVLGRLLASIAPVLLGPSPAERLAGLARRADERTRIARELHDSIGHALSLVTVQASAARRVIEHDPRFAEQALATIETSSRRAVADLDHMLGLLRDEGQQSAARAPVPTLAGIDALLTAARSAGLEVDLAQSGRIDALPVLVSQEAYRIVQEGLTNAMKYAADATARLRLSVDRDVMRIEMVNAATARGSRRVGRGLRGIQERAATLGGHACADAANGRWTLAVTLPIGAAR